MIRDFIGDVRSGNQPTKLSDPAHGMSGLQPERDGRVRRSGLGDDFCDDCTSSNDGKDEN